MCPHVVFVHDILYVFSCAGDQECLEADRAGTKRGVLQYAPHQWCGELLWWVWGWCEGGLKEGRCALKEVMMTLEAKAICVKGLL